MATSAGTSKLKSPWAWFAAVVVFDLVLALSTTLYVVNPASGRPLPWWAAVVAPALVYALVLPLCVPRIRIGGWLAGFFTLAVLHVGIGLATARLYAMVRATSFEQALPQALGGFPPALVLAMIGSVVIALPFLRPLAPRGAAPDLQAETAPPREESMPLPPQAPPDVIPAPGVGQGEDRSAWARQAGAESAARQRPPGVTPPGI